MAYFLPDECISCGRCSKLCPTGAVVEAGIALGGTNSASKADRRAGGNHGEINEQAEQNREK